jgi:hypothetical protein
MAGKDLGQLSGAPTNLNVFAFEKDATVRREAHFLYARDAEKMAVTRSLSAKKVVCKAVAVKVTKSSRGKYVSWDDSYNQLFAFRKKEEHCRPHFSSRLGKWCTQQRSGFNTHHLSQDHIEKLATIDFQFCLHNKKQKKRLKWDDRYEERVDYKKENGHANPPKREGQLGTWCHNQRKLFQNQFSSTGKATLLPYQEEKLAEIGFLFKQQTGRKRTLQRANLPATPDLLAWSDMPALLEIPTLPDMQTLSSLAILPNRNVIAV